MSNYDEAIKIVDKIYNKTDFTKEELQPLIDYLNKSETTEKEHEALKKDVSRYFDLSKRYLEIMFDDDETANEIKVKLDDLYEKLSKVGKKE